MKLKINPQKLGKSLFIIAVFLLIVHLLVLAGLIPPTVVWDTTITDNASIAISEAIAIFFILLFMIGILGKLRFSIFKIFNRLADPLLWIMVVYFLLNVIGSLLSDNAVGKLVYAPLTFVLSVLVFLLIIAPAPAPARRKRKAISSSETPKKHRRSA